MHPGFYKNVKFIVLFYDATMSVGMEFKSHAWLFIWILSEPSSPYSCANSVCNYLFNISQCYRSNISLYNVYATKQKIQMTRKTKKTKFLQLCHGHLAWDRRWSLKCHSPGNAELRDWQLSIRACMFSVRLTLPHVACFFPINVISVHSSLKRNFYFSAIVKMSKTQLEQETG